jgi:hypothetical protein
MVRISADGASSSALAICEFNVRFGSKADIAIRQLDVRFTPESGHRTTHSITSLARAI